MNDLDLDLVAGLRAGVPEPPSGRLAVGRARLTAAIRARTSPVAARSRRRRLNRLAVAICASVAAAATIGATIAAAGGMSSARKPHPAVLPALLAAKLLRTAASVAARDRAAEPRPGQWFYRDIVGYQYGQQPAFGTDAEWATFDGRYSAYYVGGQLIVHQRPAPPPARGSALHQFANDVTPLTAYRALASLPSNPKALLAAVAAQVPVIGAENIASGSPLNQYAPTSASQLDFDYLTLLMWNATDGEPPTAQARVYRALAEMPGVSVQQGITDAAGRPAIGVSDDGGIEQLLINPRTFAVIGMREISTGVSPVYVKSKAQMIARLLAGLKGRQLAAKQAELRKYGNLMWQKAKAQDALPWPPKGAPVTSIAIAELKAVAGPGMR
jgi:hypothetical protein